MELGEAEALGVFDEHERGVRHVDADLDDGGGNENIDLMRGKGAHDGILLLRFHLAVDGGDAKVGEDLFLQRFRVGGDGLALVGELVVFSDHGADDVGLAAIGDELAQEGVDARMIARWDGEGVDLLPPGGKFVENGHIEIAIDHQRERARNGRCRHDEKMRVFPLGGERGALIDTETVLLVGDDETEVLILHIGREQGVRADDEGKLAGAERFVQGAALFGLGRGCEQRAGDAEGREQRRERAVVLLGEDLGRRHEGALKTAFRGHVNGGGSDHRFA